MDPSAKALTHLYSASIHFHALNNAACVFSLNFLTPSWAMTRVVATQILPGGPPLKIVSRH